MTFQFRHATRENVGLLLGLAGASGSGKTYSAMRLATGIVGKGNRFAVIDTEARRALHYADQFEFDHAELRPPFRPDAYTEAIKAADAAGYGAIVIDSFSHEWAGEGGVLDWQEEELQRMAGTDYAKRERVKMASWIKPKMAHKAMVQRLLQVRAHLIVCLRAEEKVEMVKGRDGKTQIVPKGWQPVCAKDFPFELTASFLLTPDRPGVPQALKLQEQHKPIFPEGAPIDEAAGQRLAAWAKGADKQKPAEQTAEAPAARPQGDAVAAFWQRDNFALRVPQSDGKPAWGKWDGIMRKAIDSAPDGDALDLLYSDNTGSFDAYEAANKRGCDLLRQHVEFTRKRLADMAGNSEPEKQEEFFDA